MEFTDVDIDIPAVQTGKTPRPAVVARVRVPSLTRAAHAATVHRHREAPAEIHHQEGAFFLRMPRTDAQLTAAENLRKLFRPAYPGAKTQLDASDLETVGDRFALFGGLLLQRIHEPVWLVETKDTAGRMLTRDNAKQGVSARLSCDIGSWREQDFRPGPLPPAASPCAVFHATRQADAEGLIAPVVTETAWGQDDHRRGEEHIDVIRPDLFVVDDRALTVRMLGPMLVSLAHAMCGALTRAGIERWIELRRLVADRGARDEEAYARIQELAAGLLREVRGLGSDRLDVDAAYKRTRNCAAMLVHRLDADNRLGPEPDRLFGAAP